MPWNGLGMNGKSKDKNEKLLLLGTSLAYILIGLEVLFMITPFALYFYGVYGPVLDFLSASRLTAWTTEFFLPHMVFVSDPLLIALSWLQALFVIGLVLFLLAAVLLYYGRMTGKGVVTFGPYSRIRHPQYLALAVSGFGLLLYWPRFIVLIFYVTMLFVYYLLARNEEWRMKREQPGSYETYMAGTWMFLPSEPGGWLYRRLFGVIRPKGLGLFLAYGIVLGLSLGAAFALRSRTLDHLPSTQVDSMNLVSVYSRPLQDMEEIYRKALESAEVRRILAADEVHLAYVMPGDFFLTGLILQEGPRYSAAKLERYPHLRDAGKSRHSGGLVKFFRLGYKFFQTIGTTRRVYDYERLVFVATRDVHGKPVRATDVLAVGVRRTPALVVDIDAETLEIVEVAAASGENAWGRLPMPNF